MQLLQSPMHVKIDGPPKINCLFMPGPDSIGAFKLRRKGGGSLQCERARKGGATEKPGTLDGQVRPGQTRQGD